MPTAAAPRGKLIDYLIKEQSSFSALPSGNWFKTFVYKWGLEEKRPHEMDPLLGLARNNNRDTTLQAQGLSTLSGSLEVPADLNHLWFWLYRLFGTPVSTGGPDYVHTFTSGGEVLPTSADEIKLLSGIFLNDLGMLASRWSGDHSKKAGYDRFTVDIEGRSQQSATSTQGGAPAAALARDALPAFLPIVKLGGVQKADTLGASFTYDNKPTAQSFMSGDQYISGFDLDQEATFEGTLKLRFRDKTLYDQAVADTTSTLTLLWQKSSTRLLQIDLPIARLEQSGPKVDGPGLIEQDFAYHAEQDANNPMVTVTLKNGTAAASYS